MNRLGSGENGQWTFIDLLSILSFMIGVENLELNVAQEDLDNQTQELDRRLKAVIDEIHSHLEAQDEKIDTILKLLEESK